MLRPSGIRSVYIGKIIREIRFDIRWIFRIRLIILIYKTFKDLQILFCHRTDLDSIRRKGFFPRAETNGSNRITAIMEAVYQLVVYIDCKVLIAGDYLNGVSLACLEIARNPSKLVPASVSIAYHNTIFADTGVVSIIFIRIVAELCSAENQPYIPVFVFINGNLCFCNIVRPIVSFFQIQNRFYALAYSEMNLRAVVRCFLDFYQTFRIIQKPIAFCIFDGPKSGIRSLWYIGIWL